MPRRGIERLTYGLYARLGPRVLMVAITAVGCLAVLLAFVTTVWESRYLQLSTSEWLFLVWSGIPLPLAFGVFGVLTRHAVLRTVLQWDGTPERAPETWRALVLGPMLVTRSVAVFGSIGLLAPITASAIVLELPAWTFGLLVLVAAEVLAISLTLGVFAVDLLVRPMAEDVFSRLPRSFEPPARPGRLRRRALVAWLAVAPFTALTTGAFANLSDDGSVRLAIAQAVALCTIVVTGAVFLAVTRSLLAPLDDLVEATKRVRAGDIGTPVPVTTGDELGIVAHSFNLMLDDLGRRREELIASRARVVAAGDAERRRVERDIHDGAQQSLVLLRLKLGMLERTLARDPERAAALVAELQDDVSHALEELRDLAQGIYPPALTSEGLRAALDEAAARAAIPTHVGGEGTGRYPADIEAAVYFCCLEALQNAAKHAGPGTSARITLHAGADGLDFTVADTGPGFDPAAVNAGHGLQNMRDRIGALGGELSIDSEPGHGTRVRGRVPVPG